LLQALPTSIPWLPKPSNWIKLCSNMIRPSKRPRKHNLRNPIRRPPRPILSNLTTITLCTRTTDLAMLPPTSDLRNRRLRTLRPQVLVPTSVLKKSNVVKTSASVASAAAINTSRTTVPFIKRRRTKGLHDILRPRPHPTSMPIQHPWHPRRLLRFLTLFRLRLRESTILRAISGADPE